MPAGNRLAGVVGELAALAGEGHVSVVAFEQGNAQRVLKSGNVPAEGRRTDVAALARTAKVQGVREGQKHLQRPYFQRLILPGPDWTTDVA